MMLTPEERAIVRMRYIARAQEDSLGLHNDLCLRVLTDYGCEPVVTPDPNRPGQLVTASWPRPGQARGSYSTEILPHMIRRILEQTEQTDAVHAADALAPESEQL